MTVAMDEVEQATQPELREHAPWSDDDQALADILICPITSEKLHFRPSASGGVLATPSGSQSYARANGAWDLMPDPMPPALASKAELWQTLQANGAFVYDADPRQNLTTDDEFADKLQGLMGLRGRVLDVGCGPQRQKPAYLSHVDDDKLIGIDPLPGCSERDFPFIKAIAEALPFEDGVFEQVVFCRTLDHMLDFKAALASAVRVTAPGGRVHILMDDVSKGGSSAKGGLSRLLHIVRRGAVQIGCAIRDKGLRQGLSYAWNTSRMHIPDGAMDFFHAYFPQEEEVARALREAGAPHVETLQLGAELLITARKNGA